MSDSYVETSREGYFGRIGNSIKGILVGAIFVVVAVVALFWNEGRAVHRAKVLAEGAANVVPVDSKAVNPANEGKLVHFTGDATGETLADTMFGVSREGVHLKRVAEMYQWKEEKKTETRKDHVGGGTTSRTTYSYKQVWDDDLHETSNFDGPGRSDGEHVNPKNMRVPSQTFTAGKVQVGAFTLPPSLVGEIDNYKPVPVDDAMLSGVSSELKDDAVVADGQFYLANAGSFKPDPKNPEVGDVRVSFQLVPPGPVSVIAQQSGSTLTTYQASAGPLEILYTGTRTAADMFKAEESKNSTLAWLIRGGGFLVMWIGLAVMLNPLKVLADVVGILGDLVGIGVALVAALAAFVLSLTTIAIAWIVYRPVLGISLLVIAGAAVWWFVRLRRQRAAQRPPAVAPQNLPPLPPLPS